MVEEEADVVIAKTGEGYEPLHALYRRSVCLPAIEKAIAADQWKVTSWFPQVRVFELNENEIKAIDPDGLCFWNLNTPDEFAKAEQKALAGA
jgi:molybdopterin-guanine dinucleotide biosynthesis protein A